MNTRSLAPNTAHIRCKRRFTCLAPGLIRLEFSPDGVFEERRSIINQGDWQSHPFDTEEVSAEGSLKLSTGTIDIIDHNSNKAFAAGSLELHWRHGGHWQLWQPDDIDYENLGGCLRSLDRFNESARLEGVHPAGMESPDKRANTWLCGMMANSQKWFYEEKGEIDWWKLYSHGGKGYNPHEALANPPQDQSFRARNQTRDQWRYPAGLLSRSGYFFLNDSDSPVDDGNGGFVERDRPGYQDWYFFASSDYKEVLKLFRLLSGAPSMPMVSSLGLMLSRWPTFSEKEVDQLLEAFRQHGIPLSTMILDLEWSQEGWCHWDWDLSAYPNPTEMIQRCHGAGADFLLNVHPQRIQSNDKRFAHFKQTLNCEFEPRQGPDGDPEMQMLRMDLCDPQQAALVKGHCAEPLMEQGVDYLWLDGTAGRIAGASSQLLNNKLFFESSQQQERRGGLLSRYGGLGSHRYGSFFTGDTASQWKVLKAQCEFNIRAGQSGIGLISHDIGGFVSKTKSDLIEPALFLRWLQFGVLNPVFRMHSAPGSGSRIPWDYPEAISESGINWLQWRLRMVPYFYHALHQYHQDLLPLNRGLYLDYPKDEQAYRFDEFLLGDHILTAPVLTRETSREIYIPEGKWFSVGSSQVIRGSQTFQREVSLEDIPLYAKAGSVIPTDPRSVNTPLASYPELELHLYAGNGEGWLYEDDGRTVTFEKGVSCKTHFTQREEPKRILLGATVEIGIPLFKERNIRIKLVGVENVVAAKLNGNALEGSCIQPSADHLWNLELGRINSSDHWSLEIITG